MKYYLEGEISYEKDSNNYCGDTRHIKYTLFSYNKFPIIGYQ